MENNIKEESRLKFQFAENDTVIKFDDTKFYRDYFNKLPEAKGVDFISVAKDKIAFIEVKNCTGDEGNNRWRIAPDNRKRNTTHTSVNVEGRDSLDIEIAQKTAMTVAALVGAKSFGNTKECLNELKEYVKNALKEHYKPARVNKQIKEYVQEYGYTHSGILKSLQSYFSSRFEIFSDHMYRNRQRILCN